MKIGSFKFSSLNFKSCLINIYSETYTLSGVVMIKYRQLCLFIYFFKNLPDWYWEENRNTILIMASELKKLVV